MFHPLQLNSLTAPPKLKFSGDVHRLEQFADISTTPDTLEFSRQKKYFIERPGVTVAEIIDKINREGSQNPFVITGSKAAGKTTMALHLMDALRNAGEAVEFLSNRKGNYQGTAEIEKIRKELERFPREKNYYLVVDEPMFMYLAEPPRAAGIKAFRDRFKNDIAGFRQRRRLGDVKLQDTVKFYTKLSKEFFTHIKPPKSPVLQLQRLSLDFPNLRLIGVMFDGGFDWPYIHFRGKNAEKAVHELNALFPLENRITLAPVDKEPKETIFQMLNNVLDFCGFGPLSPEAEEALAKKLPVHFRDIIYDLSVAIKGDTTRVNDVNIREPIKPEHWKKAWKRL